MTPVQMQLSFLQKIGESINRDFDIPSIDIEKYINLAIENFVDSWYNLFEVNEAARKRLGSLVKSEKITSTGFISEVTAGAKNLTNGTFVQLPVGLRYTTKEYAKLGTSTEYTRVVPINLDYYNQHILNSFKKPYNKLSWRIDIGNGVHEIVTDGTALTEYFIHYVKNPVYISISTNTSTDIKSDFHEEIIDKAVQIALQILSIKSTKEK